MSTPITTKLAQQLEFAETEWNLAKLQALMDIDHSARQVASKRFGNIRAGFEIAYTKAFWGNTLFGI